MPGETTTARERRRILLILCACVVLIVVNSSSLNVALPTISRELRATNAELQWIVAAYSLVFAGLLFTCASIGDRFGRRRVLLLGLGIFALVTTAASLSTAAWQVIACRGLMGVGAALVMPSTLSIITSVFPSEERPRAIAAWAGVTGVAGTLGPLASGYLLEHSGYRAVFLLNLPIALVALAGAAAILPRSRDPHSTPLDPVGAALSILTLAAAVYGLITAPSVGWLGAATGATAAISVAAGALFVWWERRHEHPMLDLGLFRRAPFTIGIAGITTAFLAMFGATFLLTQYFQLVLGLSPFATALQFLPTGLTLVAVSAFTPRLSRRFGANRVASGGLWVVAASMAMLLLLRHDSPFLFVLAAMVVLLAGLGLTLSPLTDAVMSTVPADRPGAGSATSNSTRELGGALGVAVLGSWAASAYVHSLERATSALSLADRRAAETSLADALAVAERLPPDAARQLTVDAQTAFVGGIRLAVLVPLGLAVLAAVVVWRRLPGTLGDHDTTGEPAEPADAAEAAEEAAELGFGPALTTTNPARWEEP